MYAWPIHMVDPHHMHKYIAGKAWVCAALIYVEWGGPLPQAIHMFHLACMVCGMVAIWLKQACLKLEPNGIHSAHGRVVPLTHPFLPMSSFLAPSQVRPVVSLTPSPTSHFATTCCTQRRASLQTQHTQRVLLRTWFWIK